MGRRARRIAATNGKWYIAVRQWTRRVGHWKNQHWLDGGEETGWTASMPYDTPGKAMAHNGGRDLYDKALVDNPEEPLAYIMEVDWQDGRRLHEDHFTFHERLMLKHGRLADETRLKPVQPAPPAGGRKSRKSKQTGN